MTRRFAVSIALLFLTLSQSDAQDSAFSRSTLEELDGVYIYVEPVDSILYDKGITEFVVSAEVERRLREAGIPVLVHDPDGPDAPGVPTLYVQVVAIIGEYVDRCVYSVRVELTQTVQLDRDETFPAFPAATWGVGSVGSYGSGWRKALLEDVGSFTSRFADAYLEANSRLAGDGE